MRSRIIVRSLVLLGVAAMGSVGVARPTRQWAAFNIGEATSIAGAFVMGPIAVVHDDARMARGEPCTSVHGYWPGKGIGEEIVSFYCKPRWTTARDKLTLATTRNSMGVRVLTEFQFAGDEEAHGVPLNLESHK